MIIRNEDLFTALDTEGPLPRIIAHVVNDIGKWGKGFTSPLTDRYPVARETYERLAKSGRLELGTTIIVPVAPRIHVAHMCAQRGVYSRDMNPHPFQLDAFAQCVSQVRNFALALNGPVWMPKVGAGLGRGHFPDIQEVIQNGFKPVQVVVFEIEK